MCVAGFAAKLKKRHQPIQQAKHTRPGTTDCEPIDIPMAMAVLPVPGVPAISTALPAILPSSIILQITPAALRASSCPTIPWDTPRGSRASSSPRPRMCECAPMRSMRVKSLTSPTLTAPAILSGISLVTT